MTATTYFTVWFQDTEGEITRAGTEAMNHREVRELIQHSPAQYSITEWFGTGSDDDDVIGHLNGEEWMDLNIPF